MTGYLTAILAAVIWGLVYAVRQKTLPVVSPLGMMFISGIITVICTLPLVLVYRNHLSQIQAASWHDLAWITAASLIGVFALWLIYVSIEQLGATTAAVIEISYPLFTVLFCWLLMGTPLNWAVAAGGVLIFAGTCIIMLFGRAN